MASPSPVTMPAIELAEGSVFILKKGAVVIGQAINVRPKSSVPTKKVARIGDTNKNVSYQPAEHSVDIEIYTEFDPNQLAALLGGTAKPGSGGWVGTEILRLNPSIAAFDLTLEMYKTALGTSDALAGIWTMDDFKPTSLDLNVQSENASTITINGECADIFYEPEAGYA